MKGLNMNYFLDIEYVIIKTTRINVNIKMSSIKSKRFQSAKIIISESVMVLAVVVTVVVLAFVVSGYWLNADFEVERQGMLQISSVPTGAHISIDQETLSWLSVTNTSKVLSSGEHVITLTKDGYDTWTKTINITEGLLYRLHYPRLFLANRLAESVSDIGATNRIAVSPDRSRAVLINNTSEWSLMELNSESPRRSSIDISKLFPEIIVNDDTHIGFFSGEVIEASWDGIGAHLLLKIKKADTIEWVILDVDNPERSINLTKEFGADFDHIEIYDRSANNLLAVRNHNLHRINLSNKSISAVLVKNVIDFDHLGDEIFFSAQHDANLAETGQYYIGHLKGDNEIEDLKQFPSPAKIVVSKFYENTYITTLVENDVIMYRYDGKKSEENLRQTLSFSPDHIQVGHHGEFIIFSKDNTIATLDMEANLVREWKVDGETFGWLDNDMVYSIHDASLIVYDYDSLNRRELSHNVSAHYPVFITDDKWMYYVSDGTLTREWLIER